MSENKNSARSVVEKTALDPATATEKAIVIRDRRKPNQYTTDNVVAREWLPILRIGDAFYFYSVYLSMANRETESSWGSLRTMAQYLQCGVDLVIRGNKLLEICELVHIETGNQQTSNEYYILDPPTLTPELGRRILHRLDEIAAQETSQNWQSWVQQVRKALERYQSLPQIWEERRNHRSGRPVKTMRPEKGGCGSQPPHEQATLPENGACEAQPGNMCVTDRVVVQHNQGARVAQAEQEKQTGTENNEEIRNQESLPQDTLFVQNRCQAIGVVSPITAILLEKYPLELIVSQLDWLPARNPRDPAAMLVRSVQENWLPPAQYDPLQAQEIWKQWQVSQPPGEPPATVDAKGVPPPDEPGPHAEATAVWKQVLIELEMQMTRVTFDQWLRGSRVKEMRLDTFIIGVRDGYAVEWLTNRMATAVQRTLAGVVGRPVTVRFEAF